MKHLKHLLGVLMITGLLVVAGPASAVPLEMDPDSVVINSGEGGSLEYTLLSGDTDDNILIFNVHTTPSVLDTITIAFDSLSSDVSVDGVGVVDDPDGIILGIVPLLGVATELVVDLAGGESDASFFVALTDTPESAKFWRWGDEETVPVAFAPVPEPTAVALFGLGALVVSRAIRRRR